MELYDWQTKAISQLKGNNGIVCAPTGEGKTAVAKVWADFDNASSVIFTAPTKAISNERYFELLDEGYDVGLVTGDAIINPNAKILCMTQEIYTDRYAEYENQKVIFDEIGYIGQDLDRQDVYFEGLVKTPKSSKVLCMSATINNINELQNWLEYAKEENFHVYETEQRNKKISVVDCDFDFESTYTEPNSLIFAFSKRKVESIAQDICVDRFKENNDANVYKLGYVDKNGEPVKKRVDLIVELAKICDVYDNPNNRSLKNSDGELTNFGNIVLTGVGIYYGDMTLNEKIFVETALKTGLIDTVVGTDALALGVNLPCENVYIMDYKKMGQYLTNNEIIQMVGRAGRAKEYRQGYAYFTDGVSYPPIKNISELKPDNLTFNQYSKTKKIEENNIESFIKDNIYELVDCLETAEGGYSYIDAYLEASGYDMYAHNAAKTAYTILDCNIKSELAHSLLKEVEFSTREAYKGDLCDNLYRIISNDENFVKNCQEQLFQKGFTSNNAFLKILRETIQSELEIEQEIKQENSKTEHADELLKNCHKFTNNILGKSSGEMEQHKNQAFAEDKIATVVENKDTVDESLTAAKVRKMFGDGNGPAQNISQVFG